MELKRRTFLMAGGGLMAQTAPSNQIVLGVIGAGGRGTFVMGVFQKNPSLRVGAICDVYEPNLEQGLSNASKVAGNHPKAYRNYKELLADKDIQAVGCSASISTIRWWMRGGGKVKSRAR